MTAVRGNFARAISARALGREEPFFLVCPEVANAGYREKSNWRPTSFCYRQMSAGPDRPWLFSVRLSPQSRIKSRNDVWQLFQQRFAKGR